MNRLLENAIDRISAARAEGYNAGRIVGQKEARSLVDGALGLGAAIGFGIGIVFTVFVGPAVARWLS